ncbi:MAG: hypothetical protein AAGF11_46400 [Myxococcota bacterium]
MLALRSLLVSVWWLTLACGRPAQAAPSQEPTAQAEEPPSADEPAEPTPSAQPAREPASVLDEPIDDDYAAAPVSSKPAPFDVVVDAIITKRRAGATVLEVGTDPRFTLHMEIEKVEPETPLLVPGPYDVLIHSPSRSFRGPVPGKGQRIQFNMTIVPEDPSDPHDELFFAALWAE